MTNDILSEIKEQIDGGRTRNIYYLALANANEFYSSLTMRKLGCKRLSDVSLTYHTLVEIALKLGYDVNPLEVQIFISSTRELLKTGKVVSDERLSLFRDLTKYTG